MTAIAVVSVILIFAIPGFNGLIEKYQINLASSELRNALHTARMTGIKNARPVHLQKISEIENCATNSDSDWSCGWQVVRTLDSNAKETVQRFPLHGASHILNQDGNKQLTFDRWGQLSAPGVTSFSISGSAERSKFCTGKILHIQISGNVKPEEDPLCK